MSNPTLVTSEQFNRAVNAIIKARFTGLNDFFKMRDIEGPDGRAPWFAGEEATRMFKNMGVNATTVRKAIEITDKLFSGDIEVTGKLMELL